jgi:hypothetical protein
MHERLVKTPQVMGLLITHYLEELNALAVIHYKDKYSPAHAMPA